MYEVDPRGIATLTITQGGPLNIINSATAEALTTALRAVAIDTRVRVLVLRGSGEKTFIGGADIKEMARLDSAAARVFITRLHALCEAARDLPVPSVAAIQGWCIGVGLELAAACDLRVATADSHFTMPEVNIGIPSVIQGAFLSRLIGEGRARWMMLTGLAVDAAKGEQWGMLNELCPRGELDQRVDALAGLMAGHGAAGMRAQKRVLRTSEQPHLDAAMQHSIEIFGNPFETAEPRTAMEGFLNRKAGKAA